MARLTVLLAIATLALGAVAGPVAQPTDIAAAAPPLDDAPDTITCGAAVCKQGTTCCNESCGTCVAPGETCSAKPCQDLTYRGGRCGPTRCGRGMVCCNSSCGICTPPGWFCTQQVCSSVA